VLRLAWYIRPIRFEIRFERKKNDSQVSISERPSCSVNLEDGDPREADVVERYCALERVVLAGSTVGVVDMPVDTRSVGRRVVGERRSAAIARQSVLDERRQVGALGHTFRASRTTDEVVLIVAVVLRQLHAVLSHTRHRCVTTLNHITSSHGENECRSNIKFVTFLRN